MAKFIDHDTSCIKVDPKAGKSPTLIEYEKLLADPPRKNMDVGDLWSLAMERTKK